MKRLPLVVGLSVLATACAGSPPPPSGDGAGGPATKAPPPKRPPRRPGFGGGGSAGKGELEEAIKAAKANDLDTTIEKCREAITKNPNLEQAYLLLGSACSLKDDAPCERSAYEEGLEALPASLALHTELGFLDLQEGKYPEAIAHYEKADEISGSKNADVIAHLAYARGLSGAQDEALKLAARATSMDDKCGRCAAIHGRLLLASGDGEAAIAMFQRAMKLDANDIDAAGQLAKAYFLSKNYDEATKLYRELISKTDDPGLKSELAIVLMKQKRYKDAAAELKKLAELFPDERRLLERLLEAQKASKDTKGARATKKKLEGMK